MHLTPEVECTLEVNPESLTEAMVKDLFALGVTRLSFGVQSFDDAVLATLGRAHDAEQARKAIERAQLRFENISLDLMCGIPGQSIDSFRSSVEEALSLGVTHVSIYPLTIEEGTRLRDLMDRSAFVESEDALSDAAAEMMVCAEELLVRTDSTATKWRAMHARGSNASTIRCIGQESPTLASVMRRFP